MLNFISIAIYRVNHRKYRIVRNSSIMSTNTKFKRSPFVSQSKKKRGRKPKKSLMPSPVKRKLGNEAQELHSASRRKLESHISGFESESDADFEDIVDSNHVENWIIDVGLLESYLEDVAVCKQCHETLCFNEITSFRSGLATKFKLTCKNFCLENNNGFTTTKRSQNLFEINRKLVLGARLIGKGRKGMETLCSVVGLSQPVQKRHYTAHTKVLENAAFDSGKKV